MKLEPTTLEDIEKRCGLKLSFEIERARDSDGRLNRYCHLWAGSVDRKMMFTECACRCVRCSKLTPLESCSNCRHSSFEFCKVVSGGDGIYCTSCDLGMSRWKCAACGTDNPYALTVGKIVVVTPQAEVKGSGCMIAIISISGGIAGLYSVVDWLT